MGQSHPGEAVTGVHLQLRPGVDASPRLAPQLAP